VGDDITFDDNGRWDEPAVLEVAQVDPTNGAIQRLEMKDGGLVTVPDVASGGGRGDASGSDSGRSGDGGDGDVAGGDEAAASELSLIAASLRMPQQSQVDSNGGEGGSIDATIGAVVASFGGVVLLAAMVVRKRVAGNTIRGLEIETTPMALMYV
jgi:hypothetical protein